MHFHHNSVTKPQQSGTRVLNTSELSQRICDNLTGQSSYGWGSGQTTRPVASCAPVHIHAVLISHTNTHTTFNWLTAACLMIQRCDAFLMLRRGTDHWTYPITCCWGTGCCSLWIGSLMPLPTPTSRLPFHLFLSTAIPLLSVARWPAADATAYPRLLL